MSNNKFYIQCFKCQKNYENDGISRRCKHCKSRNIEVKSGGSIIDFDNSLIFTYETCGKCNKFNKVGSPDSDILPEEIEEKKQELKTHNNWCEGSYQQKPNDQEKENILNYFKQHNIKSIKLENDKLVIEYNNSQTETKDINTTELQTIKSYCQQHNNSVNYQQLVNLDKNNNKPTNWTPWILGGVGIVVVIIGLVWWVKRNKNKKEKLEY